MMIHHVPFVYRDIYFPSRDSGLMIIDFLLMMNLFEFFLLKIAFYDGRSNYITILRFFTFKVNISIDIIIIPLVYITRRRR
jgi:hypothetical protein